MTGSALDIEFDPGPHRYRLRGKVVPSVTQILAPLVDLSGIPAQILERARYRGQLAHEVCDLDNKGALANIDDLDPSIIMFLCAWREWQAQTGAVIQSEFRVASYEFGYAGTIDNVALIRDRLTLVDLKATAEIPKPVGPQTAAYARAYYDTTGQKIQDRIVVRLDQRESRTRSQRLNDPADWSVFHSCLNIYKWKLGSKTP